MRKIILTVSTLLFLATGHTQTRGVPYTGKIPTFPTAKNYIAQTECEVTLDGMHVIKNDSCGYNNAYVFIARANRYGFEAMFLEAKRILLSYKAFPESQRNLSYFKPTIMQGYGTMSLIDEAFYIKNGKLDYIALEKKALSKDEYCTYLTYNIVFMRLTLTIFSTNKMVGFYLTETKPMK